MGSRLASIGSAMPAFHTEIAGESSVLAISSDCARNRFGLSLSPSRTHPTVQSHGLRVGLRSHWSCRGQDRIFSGEAATSGRRASKPSRWQPEARQSDVKPLRHLDQAVFRKISAPHVAISSATRKPGCFGAKWVVGKWPPLTRAGPGCELQAPEASWPAPSRSERRCGRYPPLQVPTSESGSAWSLESTPEAVQPVEQRMALLAVVCQTFPENEPCIRAVHPAGTRCRATVPVIPSSMRTSRSTRLC